MSPLAQNRALSYPQAAGIVRVYTWDHSAGFTDKRKVQPLISYLSVTETRGSMTLADLGSKIVPVILSGGSGTRLWPVSRKSFPKQFWPLISEQSLLAETALRAHSSGFTAPIVVANQEHRFVVAEHLRNAGIKGAQILLEPVGRNSAPAIAAAALLAAETNPDAVLWIMAADASITDQAALQNALKSAAAVARAG